MATKTYGDRRRSSYIDAAEAAASELDQYDQQARSQADARRMFAGPYEETYPGLTDVDARKSEQRSAANMMLGVPEAAMTIGSSVAADMPAGYAGMMAAGDDRISSVDAVETVQNALTYEPRSEAGQRVMGMMGNAMQSIMDPITRGVDATLAAGTEAGIPAAAMAIPFAAITAAGEVVPGPQKGGVKAGRYVSKADELAEMLVIAEKHDPNVTRAAVAADAGQPLPDADPSLPEPILGETSMGRSQRGSLKETGGGREVGETAAARGAVTSAADERFKASDYKPQSTGVRAQEAFNQRSSEARQAMGDADAAQVDAALPKDFKGKTYMTDDGASGFAVSSDGYVSNLFKHPDAPPGAMGAALTKARAAGAKNLEAFDTYLAEGYIKRGAVETGRSPWNPEYATPEIQAALGDVKPDFVQMDIGGAIPTQKHSQILGPREQNALNRQPTPRGEPPVVAEAFKGGKVSRLNRLVDKGVEAGGEKWYWMAGMLDKFVMEFGPELGVKRFDHFMDLNAAVSPRSNVAQQIKRASILYQRSIKGESIANLSHDMFPPGYGHMATTTAHRPAVNRLNETGSVGSSVEQPKISSYAENMKGNYEPITVDSHNNLITTGRGSSPGGAQYPHLEGRQVELAARKGMSPAEWQSALWVGGGDITGVADVRNLPDAMNQRIAKTAEALDIPEEEALVRFMHGDTALYSVMGAMFLGGALADEEEQGVNALNN